MVNPVEFYVELLRNKAWVTWGLNINITGQSDRSGRRMGLVVTEPLDYATGVPTRIGCEARKNFLLNIIVPVTTRGPLEILRQSVFQMPSVSRQSDEATGWGWRAVAPPVLHSLSLEKFSMI
jgi:hypothetical protein